MGDDSKGQLSGTKRAVKKSTEWRDEEGGRRLEDESECEHDDLGNNVKWKFGTGN